MSQASPASPVPCSTRAVTVFVLLLLVGVVGAQTQRSLRCMAAGITVQDTKVTDRCRVPVAVRSASPRARADCRQRLAAHLAPVSQVSDALWPPPRGPDPVLG